MTTNKSSFVGQGRERRRQLKENVGQMPGDDRKIDIRHFLFRSRWPLSFAIRNPQPTIRNPCGGIAQLVERQLCKLEVRGSNPLASSLRSRRRGE